MDEEFLKQSWFTAAVYFLLFIIVSIIIAVPLSWITLIVSLFKLPLLTTIFGFFVIIFDTWIGVKVSSFFINRRLVVNNLEHTIQIATALYILANFLIFYRDFGIPDFINLSDNISFVAGLLKNVLGAAFFYFFTKKYLKG
jgi:hypothetical protein